MSIAGYLSSRRPEIRLRRNCGGEVGAAFDGAVLTGETSVEARIARDAVCRVAPADECYGDVAEYDPVLRAHCRV